MGVVDQAGAAQAGRRPGHGQGDEVVRVIDARLQRQRLPERADPVIGQAPGQPEGLERAGESAGSGRGRLDVAPDRVPADAQDGEPVEAVADGLAPLAHRDHEDLVPGGRERRRLPDHAAVGGHGVDDEHADAQGGGDLSFGAGIANQGRRR